MILKPDLFPPITTLNGHQAGSLHQSQHWNLVCPPRGAVTSLLQPVFNQSIQILLQNVFFLAVNSFCHYGLYIVLSFTNHTMTFSRVLRSVKHRVLPTIPNTVHFPQITNPVTFIRNFWRFMTPRLRRFKSDRIHKPLGFLRTIFKSLRCNLLCYYGWFLFHRCCKILILLEPWKHP